MNTFFSTSSTASSIFAQTKLMARRPFSKRSLKTARKVEQRK